MQACRDQFDSRGIRIVVVSFAAPERLAVYQRMHQWPFLILADPERKAYGYFQLERLPWYRVFSPATIGSYLRLLLKGKRLENYGRDDYRQSGGDFLIDPRGAIVFAHRSHDPADRPAVESLLAAADRIRRQNVPLEEAFEKDRER